MLRAATASPNLDQALQITLVRAGLAPQLVQLHLEPDTVLLPIRRNLQIPVQDWQAVAACITSPGPRWRITDHGDPQPVH
ncbi:hypothetical protein O1L55_02515, partial [Streptomyces albulus]|nr:hypothetical protein [Streptomyces noursei]